MDLVQVGIDHHLAPLELRERLALTDVGAMELARGIRAEPWAGEVLVIATCNRTELYVSTPIPHAEERVLEALLSGLPEAPPEDADCYRKQRGAIAAQYLMRVACGLESAILGETEIQGQVRIAHANAKEAETLGPVLDRLCTSALRAGKRARAETGISAGGISHGSAALQVVERVYDDMRGNHVLVVGAGVIATQAARSLATLEGARLSVANRTPERAQALVEELGVGEACSLPDLATRVETAHVVVFATGAQPLTHDMLTEAVGRRRDPLLLIDLGLPRCIDARARELPGVFVYDLDDLEAVVADALANRRAAVPAAEAIVDEELERFRSWYRKWGTTPTIRSLHQWAEEIRREEARHAGRDLPPEVSDAIERVTRRLVNRLLGRPASRVARGAEAADPSLPTAQHLRHVFGLDENEES